MQIPVNMDIGIREIRQLTGFIKETHGVDYTDYTLTSFKRRVERLMSAHKCNFETLLKKLESKDFLEHFIGQVAVGATELFRDPTFWVLLKNIYLTNIFKEQDKVCIWLPMCASGEEFYSLAILLKENGWTQRAEIYLSSLSNENLEKIQKGWMDHNNLDISIKNHVRFQGTSQLSDYFAISGSDVNFDRSLFSNTHFFRQAFDFSNNLPGMHLILFRNQLIYFNSTLQYKTCDLLHGKLAAKGLLALGILEEIDLNVNDKYTALNKEESIYQKKS